MVRRYFLPSVAVLFSTAAIVLSGAAWLGNQYDDGYKDGVHEVVAAIHTLKRGVVSAETDADGINYIEEVSVTGVRSGDKHFAPHQCWLAKPYKPGKTVYFTAEGSYNLVFEQLDDGIVRLC